MISKVFLFLCVWRSSAKLAELPVRIFHGYGDSCGNLGLRDPHPCVETGAGEASKSQSVIAQANRGCRLLSKELAALARGFYVVAYSQGGLIARHILLNCVPVRGLIKRMVFAGTPHLGYDIDGKFFRKFDGLGANRALEAWEDYATSRGAKPKFLEDLESPKADQFYKGLDLFLTIVNAPEATVKPAWSTSLGADLIGPNRLEKLDSVPRFRERKTFLEMYRSGKLVSCLSLARHNRFTDDEKEALFSIILKEHPAASSYQESAKLQLAEFLKVYPRFCDFV